MKVEALLNYNTPKYPLKQAVLNNPSMLKRFPLRWKRNIATFSVATSFILLSFSNFTDIKSKSTVLAGNGAPMTMAHLTEDEAADVISLAFQKYNIYFNIPKNTLMLNLPRTMTTDNDKTLFTYRETEIKLDGIDETKKVSYEFVSEHDLTFLVDDNAFLQYASKNYTGEYAKMYKKAKPNELTGIFYEPYKSTIELDKADLKKQVDTFISWLISQNKI